MERLLEVECKVHYCIVAFFRIVASCEDTEAFHKLGIVSMILHMDCTAWTTKPLPAPRAPRRSTQVCLCPCTSWVYTWLGIIFRRITISMICVLYVSCPACIRDQGCSSSRASTLPTNIKQTSCPILVHTRTHAAVCSWCIPWCIPWYNRCVFMKHSMLIIS